MKRLFALLLCFTLLLSGCNKKSDESSAPDEPSAPEVKVIYNPLTGEPGYDEGLLNTRPMSVMVSNIKVALPQYGLDSADICYEMETEGGITRIMAIFSDYKSMPKVGPVRSARHPFIEFSSSYNPIFTHFGGSTLAYDMLKAKNVDDIDGMTYSTTAFSYDAKLGKQKGKEHANFTDGELIQNAIDKKGISTDNGSAVASAFRFAKPEEPVSFTSVATEVSVKMSGYCTAGFTYDSTTKKYLKSEFGAPQIDANTGKQISVDNVFVLFSSVTDVPNSTILKNIDTTGGAGYYITGGTYTPITWKKGAYGTKLKVMDANGEELLVNPGQSWICITDSSNKEHVTME